MSKAKYSLPYKNCSVARRCTAPFHLSESNLSYCVDFYLPQGTPILAARPGMVVTVVDCYTKSYSDSKFNQRCNRIFIKHSDGEISVYVHLASGSAKAKVGDKVRRGQVIALSGQTGYATYPHLHFGIYNSDNKNIRVGFNAKLPPKVSHKRYCLEAEQLVCK